MRPQNGWPSIEDRSCRWFPKIGGEVGAEATNALGITDTNPEDIIHKTANALTYHPQTVEGENLSNVVAYPFTKLSETANKAAQPPRRF